MERILPYDKGTYDFFDTGQNDDAVAGFAFDFHNINGQRAVISIQGIIDFDNETIQVLDTIMVNLLYKVLRFYLL